MDKFDRMVVTHIEERLLDPERLYDAIEALDPAESALGEWIAGLMALLTGPGLTAPPGNPQAAFATDR